MKSFSLKVSGVSHKYRGSDLVLDQAGFEAHPGSILGILGPNGSGKSTLLKVAAGVLRPDAGKVVADEKDMLTLDRKARARLIGYLPQQVESHLDYKVKDVAAMGRFPHMKGAGFMSVEDRQAVDKSLADTDTVHLTERLFSTLSGGEKQRVLLASVLAQEPGVLILDEPTSAMDAHHQVRFFRLLKKLAQSGMGVAVVTHDLNLASLFSDRLVLMKGGKILQKGEPGAIMLKENLSQVFGTGMLVISHPESGRPMVLPQDGDGC